MSLLEFKGVSLRERGETLIADVDVAVEPGERLVVFGPAGSGKGTFLRLAAGVLEPTSGTVSLEAGRPGSPAPVGYLHGEGGLLSNLSLLQNVMLPAVYHRLLGPAEAQRRAAKLLEELGVARQADRRPALVSLSARRLAQLARALLIKPSVFVLEDPLSDVDAAAAHTIRGVLDGLAAPGESSAILGTGSLEHYLGWGGRFLLVREGRVRVFESRGALERSPDPDVRVFLE